MEITLSQAKKLVECFGGDEDSSFFLEQGNEEFHSGPGLYAHDEYPEHGYTFLGEA